MIRHVIEVFERGGGSAFEFEFESENITVDDADYKRAFTAAKESGIKDCAIAFCLDLESKDFRVRIDGELPLPEMSGMKEFDGLMDLIMKGDFSIIDMLKYRTATRH